MKKIIAAFDSLRFSQATLDYTIDLAAPDQAEVTGIFLSDIFYHSPLFSNKMGSKELFGEPETTLVSYLEKALPGTLVVMGACSYGAVSGLFCSSMADLLVEALELPLFITQRKL